MPTAIEFPRRATPIFKISCGSAHMLAVSEDHQMYSWGSGSYGALGFGGRVDINQPTLLKIEGEGGYLDHQVVDIACGKYHSMCLT